MQLCQVSCIYLEGFATFFPFHPTVMQEEVTTVQTTYVSNIYIQLTQTPHCVPQHCIDKFLQEGTVVLFEFFIRFLKSITVEASNIL